MRALSTEEAKRFLTAARMVLPTSLEIRLTGLEQVRLASRSATARYAALAERCQRAARHDSIPAR